MHIYCKWYNPLRVTYKTEELNISPVEVSSDRRLTKLISSAQTESLEETL